VGRLEDIADRNARENKKSRQRVWIAAGLFVTVVVTIVLAIYTDLGAPAPVDRSHANGIELRVPKAGAR
jgi:hypothetical protein